MASDFRRIARARARKYGLDPRIFERQIQQESGFNPGARSPAGAQGIAQIMPGTAAGWGVNPNNPRQALDAAAKHMAEYVHQFGGSYAKALTAYNAGPGAVGHSLPAETQNYIKTILGGKGDVQGSPGIGAQRIAGATVPTVDAAGYRHAQGLSILGALIAKRNPQSFLLRSGLLSTQAPNLADYQGTRRLPGATIPGVSGTTSALSGGTPKAGGITKFDGKPIVSSLAPALAYARAHGWKGTVTSGVRTKQQQLAAASNFGLQHYGPAGPLGSNHVEGHSGAVDVTDPGGLERALRSYKGRKPFRGMKDDPVHFSWTGH